MKILIIREAFELRLSLMMTFNNESPFQTTSSSSPYLEFTILLYKYGLPYLPTYHKFFCPNFFLEKVWLEETLPTRSVDICPKFHSFFSQDPLQRKRKQSIKIAVGRQGILQPNFFQKKSLEINFCCRQVDREVHTYIKVW